MYFLGESARRNPQEDGNPPAESQPAGGLDKPGTLLYVWMSFPHPDPALAPEMQPAQKVANEPRTGSILDSCALLGGVLVYL